MSIYTLQGGYLYKYINKEIDIQKMQVLQTGNFEFGGDRFVDIDKPAISDGEAFVDCQTQASKFIQFNILEPQCIEIYNKL